LCVLFNSAGALTYGEPAFWDAFWKQSEGWGKANSDVTGLIEAIDGTNDIVTMVDIGAGNGRNSIGALLDIYKDKAPKSNFIVYCFDSSSTAIAKLNAVKLPEWLKLYTRQSDVNRLQEGELPRADLTFLYGILEYVNEPNLQRVVDLAAESVKQNGFLVVVTLVKGPGALEIDSEITRERSLYEKLIAELMGFSFYRDVSVAERPDEHDLGKGYPEKHLHFVLRTILQRAEIANRE
jgi:2-polyprenyl-3-methyl-5-hydroxy-6-metoxy-1,4-benzoquinol methylase